MVFDVRGACILAWFRIICAMRKLFTDSACTVLGFSYKVLSKEVQCRLNLLAQSTRKNNKVMEFGNTPMDH